jgi:hypothetical protein
MQRAESRMEKSGEMTGDASQLITSNNAQHGCSEESSKILRPDVQATHTCDVRCDYHSSV